MSAPGTYDEVIEKDIELSWAVQHYVHSNRTLRDWCRRLVSKNPLQDICSVIWIVAIIGVVEMGVKHLWVVIINLFASFVLRKTLQVKRPVEYDIRLQPMTDLGAESYGIPSIESYMAVVILGHFVIIYNSILFLIFVAIPLTFIIGFSRVYSKARFAHHIVASWVLGFIGLQLTHHYCEKISIHKIERALHGFWGAVAGVVILINFALSMENNDSRLVGVHRDDFLTVLRNIMYGSSERDDERTEDGTEVGATSDGDLGVRSPRMHPATPRGSTATDTPRAAAARQAARLQAESEKNLLGVTKRDSFYFLQRTLMRRAGDRSGETTFGELNPNADTPRGTPRQYQA